MTQFFSLKIIFICLCNFFSRSYLFPSATISGDLKRSFFSYCSFPLAKDKLSNESLLTSKTLFILSTIHMDYITTVI